MTSRGDAVARINLCAGDALYWGRRPAWHYRGNVDGMEDYLRPKFERHQFTDVVLFGNRRPAHVPVVQLAEAAGARVHVFEEGYIRPNWVTLERGGVNGDSPLPRDPGWYRAVARELPRPGDGAPVHSDIRVRAAHDIAYHVGNCLNPLLYRGYRTHRPYTAPIEYAGWIRRFSKLRQRRQIDERRIGDLIAGRIPYYLLPLQLNGDIQITIHSRYGGMPQLIDTVLRSLAAHAPADRWLVIKNHPLDTGLVEYQALITELAHDLGIAGRVLYLETGHLPTLLRHAEGVVTVNSTVGMSALWHRCPTVTLGPAIYDLPGLTFQGRLEEFWEHCTPPDQQLFQAFRNTVIHATQVNGDFYTGLGIDMAVAGCLSFLAEQSPLEALLERHPLVAPARRVGQA